MEGFKTLFSSSEFPLAYERISKVYGQFGHAPSKSVAKLKPMINDQLNT
jgi:hypothetical protein